MSAEKVALLQMEYVKKGRGYHCQQIAKEAMEDTFENGGTFVLVVGQSKVTIVQRKDAEEIDAPATQTERKINVVK